MFEREIKFIYDFNLNKISRLGPYFTFEQLAATEVHPAILNYISAEIDYLVFEDRQKLLKNSVFDYSGEKTSYHFTRITEELKRTKRFAVEYVAKLILHGSSFTINYLIRPKWTLTRFVFDEEKHKTSNEIKQILNYVHYYKYLTKILVSYINTKKILSMNVEEFESLLNKADSIGLENYLPAILSNSLKSMAEFFNIGEIKKNRIPLPAVELFLEEKELFNHLKAVNGTFGSDENAKFNLDDYQKVLSRVMIEREEAQPAAEEKEEFETSEIEAPVIVEEDKSGEESITVGEQSEKQVEISEEPVEQEKVELHGEEFVEEDVEVNEEEITEEDLVEADETIEAVDNLSGGLETRLFEEGTTVAEENTVGESDTVMPIFENEEEELTESVDLGNAVNIETVSDEKGSSEKTEEIDSPPEEDVVIRTPRKFRIHFKEKNQIEPIYDDDTHADSDEKKFDLFREYGTFDADGVSNIEDDKITENETGNENNSPRENWFNEPKDLANEDVNNQVNDLSVLNEDDLEGNEDSNSDVEDKQLDFETADPANEETSISNEETGPTFQSIMEEQQNLYVDSNEDAVIGIDQNFDLDDYESEASKKLDEQIAEEKSTEKKESMFDIIKQNFIENSEGPQKVDLAEILERKEMTKIIEVIFDYDIEDFAGVLDEISGCRNVEDAHLVINQALMERHINRNSKEAEIFRSIIAHYFENS